ncbi:hypothetical protein CARUB_v10004302mg [Capsella rubella]|uniref:SWIM-type domain-containing protein n=1 Tax=Capsella rubella TaxID=81985 RepID=R0F223_9BRAS|nr:hypothetical protein CARUB_v10004302mg [Capsella rubella]
MDTRKIPVLCYWNGCIKDDHDGPSYQGSSPRGLRVDSKIKLAELLDDLHRITGFAKGKFQIGLIGKYPSIAQQLMVKYVRLPIVDDCSLEMMLEVPRYYPFINSLELYLEIKPVVSVGSLLANLATRKRFRQEDANIDAHGNASMRDITQRSTRQDTNNGLVIFEKGMDDGRCGNGGGNEAAEKDSYMKKPNPIKDISDFYATKLILSTGWLDERELHVGMIFGDKDELVKAVKLYSDRRQREYQADEFLSTFRCKKKCSCTLQCSRGCRWVLKVAETKSKGFMITEYEGPHTCQQADVGSDFLAGEIECLIKAHPSLSIAKLNDWIKINLGYTVSHSIMWDAKKKAAIAILGDLDKSFSLLPKLMAALCSSNKMLLEWQYDPHPDPKDASFRSVFWAFQQSIKGFPHCRPLIIVDTVDLSGSYPGKLLVAAGRDAEFVKEPECQWAQHRFCLKHLCLKFYDVFGSNLMAEYVSKAGSTKSVAVVESFLLTIEHMNPDARKWLDEIPRHQWTLVYDDGGMRYGVRTTNLIYRTYGFINNADDLPITTCILLIFDHLAECFKSARGGLMESLNRKDLFPKFIMGYLEVLGVQSRAHDVLPLDGTGEKFQVTHVIGDEKPRLVVDRSARLCTCGAWQCYKYPCSHMLAVCRWLKIDHSQYVDEFYSTESSLAV